MIFEMEIVGNHCVAFMAWQRNGGYGERCRAGSQIQENVHSKQT